MVRYFYLIFVYGMNIYLIDCIINMIRHASPLVQLLSMPSCILLTALRQWDRSGVTGPFPWSGYCGKLQPSIQSRWFPYHSLDRFVLESAQLTQLQTLYKLHDELALRPPHRGKILGSFQNEFCKSPVLLILSTL